MLQAVLAACNRAGNLVSKTFPEREALEGACGMPLQGHLGHLETPHLSVSIVSLGYMTLIPARGKAAQAELQAA